MLARHHFLAKRFIRPTARFISSAQFLSDEDGLVEVLTAESTNSIFNLATEEFLYEHFDIKNPTLFLWRNDKTIIMGKHQNPWKECKVQLLEQDGVLLARRKSGGACVYQDLGNSVWSFFTPYPRVENGTDYKTANNEVLINALRHFGVEAKASGRNDIEVGDRKISGSAYKLNLGSKDGRGRKVLHHGTMLLDVELGALSNYLNPSKAKLESKGVESVVARVQNLKELAPEITHESFCAALREEFLKKHQGRRVRERTLRTDEL